MTVYDMLTDFALASILILVGQFLRAKVRFFQKFFIPASMLAGFMGLALGSQGIGVLPFSDSLGTYAGLLVIAVFSIIGLNGFEASKGGEGGEEEIKRVSGNFFYRTTHFFIQFCIPIALALTVIKAIMPSINDGFGVLMVSGITAAITIGSILINHVIGSWYPKLPLAGRGGYGLEDDSEAEDNTGAAVVAE